MIRLGNIDKSALAHCSWNTDHKIEFEKTELLNRAAAWNTRLIMESVEMSLTQDTINKEDDTKLSTAWLPAYDLLKEQENKEQKRTADCLYWLPKQSRS